MECLQGQSIPSGRDIQRKINNLIISLHFSSVNHRPILYMLQRKGPAEPLQPNVNQKLISHTLIAHAGRIYIHAIDIGPIGEKNVYSSLEMYAPWVGEDIWYAVYTIYVFHITS